MYLGRLPLCILLIATSALADRLKLTNGEELEGFIEQETAEQVTLNLGVGDITLPRNRIASIQKSDSNDAARIEAAWKRQYFSHPRFVPDAWKDLAEEFNGVQAHRHQAVDAQDLIRRTQEERVGQLAELRDLEQQGVDLSRRLKAASPERDMQEYNDIVLKSNEVAARRIVLVKDVENALKKAEEQRLAVPAYLTGLHAFAKRYEERKSHGVPDEAAVFVEEVDKRMADLDHEFQELDVPYEQIAGQVVVKATINGKISGRFMLDTGASLVTLSDSLALRLHLELPPTASLKMIVADGRRVDARPVTLDSVKVGDASVSNIVAAVVAAEPAPGLDGLLGMSFLREFLVNLDPSNEKLVLEQFVPRAP